MTAQLDLAGRDAPASAPRYDADAGAESMRLFEPAPAPLPGQTFLDLDAEGGEAHHPTRTRDQAGGDQPNGAFTPPAASQGLNESESR